MKLLKFSTLVATLAISIPALSAGVCQHYPGSTICGKGEVNNVTAYGVATLNGTTVDQTTDVSGALTAIDANLNMASVKGSAILQNTTVNGTNHFFGGFNTKGSTFKKTLTISSNDVTLVDTKTVDVLLGDVSPVGTQKLHLKGNTLINGDVTFKQGHGIVYLSGNAQVSGQVNGGKVVHE